jgi:hypothetical protein
VDEYTEKPKHKFKMEKEQKKVQTPNIKSKKNNEKTITLTTAEFDKLKRLLSTPDPAPTKPSKVKAKKSVDFQ